MAAHQARSYPDDDYRGDAADRTWTVTCPDCTYSETFGSEAAARRAAQAHRRANT